MGRWISPEEYMPRKALEAAAAVGDQDAVEALIKMRDNTKTVLVILIVTVGIVTLTWVLITLITGYLASGVETANKRELEESRARATLWDKQQHDAAELRMKYVTSCRVTPEQAEQLFPGPK